MNMPWKNPAPKLSPIEVATRLNDAVAAGPVAVPAAPKPNHNFAGIIDQLGLLRAQISSLKKAEDELSEQVQALGIGEHDGTKCRAVVSSVTTMRLDTKSLTAVLPEELVKAHTKSSVSVRVSIKALV